MKSESIKAHGINTHFIRFIPTKKSADFFVLLHGWGGSAEMSYPKLGQTLSKTLNMGVIAVDLPGFGKSTPPPTAGWTTNEYETWFEDFLKQVSKKISGKIYLYGHSFGCRILVRFLTKHADWQEKVILTGAAGVKLPKTMKQKVLVALNKSATHIKFMVPKSIQRLVARLLGAHDWAHVTPALKNTLKKALAEEDLREHFPKIKTPILLLWGKNDTYTPLEAGKIFAEKLPNATLKIFDDGRHGIHYTHTDKIVSEIKSFIKA